MKIEQNDIDELETDISALRDDLTKKEAETLAIREDIAEKDAVLRFMHKKVNNAVSGIKQLKVTSSRSGDALKSLQGIIDLSAVEVAKPKVSSGVTLTDNIKALIERMGDQEFIVPQIDALLKADDNQPIGKNPRARIAMIMSALESDGVVIRTFRGKGSVPHRFKKAKPVQESFGSRDA